MRRRRRKRISPSVSLFPFLAVLICTLGVLIMLLVLAVKSAGTEKANRDNAVAAENARRHAKQVELAADIQRQQDERKAEQAKIIAELEDEIDRRELLAEGFQDDRPKLRRQVAHARDYRAHLENEIANLEKQAAQLADQIKLLDSDLSTIETSVEDDELQRLQQQVAAAEARLIEKRNSTVLVTQKKYSIVPYHGTGGTGRIPVFVECRGDGVILQPWNIRLSKADFYHPVSAGNPIDAALLAVKNYFRQHELADKDQRPYPLLVVRPEGAQAYGLARRSLVSWDDEFGYELVTADKELDFGTVDPQLQQAVATAVENSKLTQLALRQRRAAAYAAATGDLRGFNGLNGTGGKSEFIPGSGGENGQGDATSASGFGESQGVKANSLGSAQQTGFSGDEPENRSAQIGTSFESNADSVANASSQFSGNAQQSEGESSFGSSVSDESLSQSRGSNWALPTETSGATGFVRPVGIVCSADSLSLKNVSGKVVTIPFASDDTEAIDQMVNIVWQRIESWGIAGTNAFWKPNLVVAVSPGAENRFAKLKRLLGNSGLGIEEVSQ